MKKLILTCLAILSFNASSQSYIIMDNGIVVTTDKSGFIYDFGHYAYPQKITLKGGQYFVEDNSILATVDEKGLLYRKYEYIPEKILGRGINYFLSAEGELYAIDKNGLVKIVKDEVFKRASLFGGNYFMVVTDEDNKFGDIYTISDEGIYLKTSTENFKVSDVVAFGGNYFMNNRGVVHTVAHDGKISPRADVRVGIITKKGGNYFTDSSGVLFTVAEDGSIKIPQIPMGLKLNAITKLGSTYFLDLNGKLFSVDREGNIYERSMRDNDFRHARVISL